MVIIYSIVKKTRKMNFFLQLAIYQKIDLLTINHSGNIALRRMYTNKLSFFVFLLFSDYILALRGSSQCGLPVSQKKIVGGVDSGGYRYPWFALLLLKKNSFLPIPICAGTLITSLHVLTAAHCFTVSVSVEYKDIFSVALGVYDICKETESSRQIFDVENVAIHEKYQKRGKFYDIALIKLAKSTDYTFICLPLFGVPDITEVALLIGFGVTEESSNFVPCHMLEVNVTKYSKKDCSNTKLPLEDKIEPSVLCAGALSGAVDSCYGDSGGPLQTITPDGRYVISGIVSYGYGCATPDIPGIYTNVGNYLQWIRNKIAFLGNKESSTTEKQNTPEIILPARKGFRMRTKSTINFSQEKKPSKEQSPNVYFDRNRQKLNGSVFHVNGDNRKVTRTKNSKVAFPE